MTSSALVDVVSLSRDFGGGAAPIAAVRALTFELKRGEIVGLLGHNGAGKSTTMRMLAGVLAPTSGRARIESHTCGTIEARRSVGWLPESPPLTGELTVDEQLQFAAALRGLSRAQTDAELSRVVTACDLQAVRANVISTLSKGTKQRVGLAQALLGDPPVLLLDEPTAGLDPAQAASVRALIRSLATERAVLLSTHLLHDVVALCDRALLLRHGSLVADKRLDELRNTGALEATVLALLDPGAAGTPTAPPGAA